MRFTIGFEVEATKKLHRLWDEIIQSHQWTEGKFTRTFEEKWGEYHNRYAVAFSSWAGAALAALEFFNVQEKTVLCPSNTFVATPLSVVKAGGNVEIEHTEARPGDYDGRIISSEKAKRELGWVPKVDIEEGIKRYIEWFRHNGLIL
jgi:GDP-D-mannose dehydratase